VKLQADLDAEKAKVTTVTQRAERAETALTTFREDASKARISGAVDKAITEGRLLPKEKDATVAFATTLDAKTKIKFGDKEHSPLDQYLDTLAARPKAVKFGEQGVGKGEQELATGQDADKEVDARARTKVATDKIEYAAAVQLVLNEDPDLKQRYAQGL
jgi:hypothetical protein